MPIHMNSRAFLSVLRLLSNRCTLQENHNEPGEMESVCESPIQAVNVHGANLEPNMQVYKIPHALLCNCNLGGYGFI